MAQIRICDVCMHDMNKITKTSKYLSVTGRKKLQLDLCTTHMLTVQTKFPTVDVKYVQYVGRVVYGTELDEVAARALLRTRR